MCGHLPVLSSGPNLHREQHPTPVLRGVIAGGQAEEVHTVVGVDALGHGLLGLAVPLREYSGRPAMTIVEVLGGVVWEETPTWVREYGVFDKATV